MKIKFLIFILLFSLSSKPEVTLVYFKFDYQQWADCYKLNFDLTNYKYFKSKRVNNKIYLIYEVNDYDVDLLSEFLETQTPQPLSFGQLPLNWIIV